MNVLLAAATEAEIAPTLAWLRADARERLPLLFSLGTVSVRVCVTGIGMTAAAATLARLLAREPFDFALQAGVAGSFLRDAPLGEVVLVEADRTADLGAEDADGGFLSLADLNLASPGADENILATGLDIAAGAAFRHLPRRQGITVQTVSGTESTILARRARYAPGLETMEGAAFHHCCAQAGVPFIQLRAISNYVEPRNRAGWKLAEAVKALNSTVVGWLAELAAH